MGGRDRRRERRALVATTILDAVRDHQNSRAQKQQSPYTSSLNPPTSSAPYANYANYGTTPQPPRPAQGTAADYYNAPPVQYNTPSAQDEGAYREAPLDHVEEPSFDPPSYEEAISPTEPLVAGPPPISARNEKSRFSTPPHDREIVGESSSSRSQDFTGDTRSQPYPQYGPPPQNPTPAISRASASVGPAVHSSLDHIIDSLTTYFDSRMRLESNPNKIRQLQEKKDKKISKIRRKLNEQLAKGEKHVAEQERRMRRQADKMDTWTVRTLERDAGRRRDHHHNHDHDDGRDVNYSYDGPDGRRGGRGGRFDHYDAGSGGRGGYGRREGAWDGSRGQAEEGRYSEGRFGRGYDNANHEVPEASTQKLRSEGVTVNF